MNQIIIGSCSITVTFIYNIYFRSITNSFNPFIDSNYILPALESTWKLHLKPGLGF